MKSVRDIGAANACIIACSCAQAHEGYWCGAQHGAAQGTRCCAGRRGFRVYDAWPTGLPEPAPHNTRLSSPAASVRRSHSLRWPGVLAASGANVELAAVSLVQMRASQLLFTKLVGMWDSPNWNSDGTWDGQGSGHDYWGTVSLCECVSARALSASV